MSTRLLAWSSIATVAVLVGACGGSPVCGDSVSEGDEACDDGNMNEFDGCTSACTVGDATEAHLEWTIAANELEGFNETCPGIEASTVQLEFVGPETRTETVMCTFMNTFVRGLTPGEYELRASLLDSSGNPVTSEPVSAALTVAVGAPSQTVVDFPYSSFASDYAGTFYFRLKWGGVETCDGVTPNVTEERVRIERAGSPLAGVYRNEAGDDVMITMDGTSAWPCRSFTEEFPQAVKALPWGPATVVVTGHGPGAQLLYEGSFDTFIGAGLTNPEVVLDVPAAL